MRLNRSGLVVGISAELEWSQFTLLHNHYISGFLYTDASGSWGCGACFDRQWLQWQWPPQWPPILIMAKELVPIVLSCAVWGPQLARCTVLFRCDNTGVVAAVKRGVAKEDSVMHLLRYLWFFTAYYDISLLCEHITGITNNLADHLSHCNLRSSFNRTHKPLSTSVPPSL